MREEQGNLWQIGAEADAIVITTNGAVRGDGGAVMGRGCAYEATLLHPWLQLTLGDKLREFGNHLFVFNFSPETGEALHPSLVTFPVKHHWSQAADPALIRSSAHELAVHVFWEKWERVVLPQPGCGNGRLRWEDVKPILEEVLDDRFTCVTW